MKITALFFASLLLFQYANAQIAEPTKADNGIASVDMEEVVIKASKPDKYIHAIRPENVFIVLAPSHPGDRVDSTWYATAFPQIADVLVSLYSAELKLKPFDTSLFDIKLIVFQVTGNDTLFRSINIEAGNIKKNKLKIDLFTENITLQPGEFYLGYGFHTKRIQNPTATG